MRRAGELRSDDEERADERERAELESDERQLAAARDAAISNLRNGGTKEAGS
jgi:hypothetical protein